MNSWKLICGLSISILIASCNHNPAPQNEEVMNDSDKIKKELAVMDSLLQDENFAESMARELDAAYYKGIGQEPAPFLAPGGDSAKVEKSVKEEKIAINVAGFYALECGINYLTYNNNSTPIEWLDKIITNKAGDTALLILNRFANATWKAGQPFRGIERIKRPVFTSYTSLPVDEVKKDHRQIVAAATKLRASLKPGSAADQLQQLRTLLHDKAFAYQMAVYMDSSYYAGENKPVAPFVTADEAAAVKQKTVKAEKIATNLAGFYAVECATNYLVTLRKTLPSVILQSVLDGTVSKEDKLLFARFANATWKAGQPFRGLDRITRETFTPFSFLNEADIDKDWVQVKAAAAKILSAMQ